MNENENESETDRIMIFLWKQALSFLHLKHDYQLQETLGNSGISFQTVLSLHP